MSAFTCYGNQQDVDGLNFGKLAVIAPMLERVKLKDIINQHMPADAQAEFDHGTILNLLVAARLFSPVALSNIPEWAESCGADIFWNMPIEKMNDDRFGRSLDAFFDQRHSILGAVALHVAEEFDVPLSQLHYDPTHILFEGAYDDAPQGTLMIHVGLSTVVDEVLGPLPLIGHTIGGNQNGHTGIHEQTALINEFLKLSRTTMISDRGTFSVGHLLRMHDVGHRVICAVPWKDVKQLFDAQFKSLAWKQASFLSIESSDDAKEQSPQEHYDLAVVKHSFCDDDSNVYATRVIFVFSTADQKVVRAYRQKQIDKLKAELTQITASVATGRRGTDQAAISKRIARVFGTKQAAKYFQWELKPLTSAEQKAVIASPFLREVCPTRLTIRQRNILNRLNFPTPAQILSRRLPRLSDE
ncbi:MAG: DUF4277 domain-containing protein [Planctomycetaceae bacterium]